MTEKNHYNTLNVPRDATQDNIKRSYQQLAKKISSGLKSIY